VRKNYLALFFFIFILIRGAMFCQNGKIVDKKEIYFTPEAYINILHLGSMLPTLQKFLQSTPHRAKRVNLYDITYLSDGIKVKGFLIEPKQEGVFPCLIVNRGGNRDFGAWSEEEAWFLLSEIVNWGYIVVASQYRGCCGGEGKDEFGGKDVNDILSLIPLLEMFPKADVNRIGIMGLSRGGMMTYLALSKTSHFKAAAVIGGITNLVKWEMARPDILSVFKDLIGGSSETALVKLEERSAVFWPNKLTKNTPILIIHGTADEKVPPDQALDMAEALLRVSHPFRLIMLEKGDHNLSDFWPEWLNIVHNWFDKYLKK